MRLVPNQSSDKITQLFEEHFKKIAPKSVKVQVTPHHGGEPVVTPTDSIAYKAAQKAILALPGKVSKLIHETVLGSFPKRLVSSYADISFFISQPTRAPSFA